MNSENKKKSFQSDVIKGWLPRNVPQALKVSKSYFEQTYRDWLKERMADKDDTFGFEDENKFETKLKDTGVYDGDNDAYRNMYEYIYD